jgi:polyisoprenoid-binding protein YceI
MLKIATLVVALCAGTAAAETYEIDAAHSSITFKIRHIVAKVRGRFDKFSGTFDYVDGKPASWKTHAEIDPASINTNHAGRDAHLKNADFLDVEKCPKMEFKSGKVGEVKDGVAELHGELTMHCVTKPVVLKLEIGGVYGKKAGMTATGQLDRREWGITWNKANMLGDIVDFEIDLEGNAVGSSSGAKPVKKG